MKRTIFEYAATDKFLLLYLTADRATDDLKGLHTVHREQFDPEFVEGMQDDGLGIPDIISCADVEVALDDDGNFVNKLSDAKRPHSFRAKSMLLTWTQPGVYTDRVVKHRLDGPAEVTFREFTGSHTKGVRSGFGLASWQFVWYMNNRMRRDAGPYAINGDRFDATVDPYGNIRTLKKLESYQYAWNHPAGGNLTEPKIQEAIKTNAIELNRLDPGASVFANSMEQAFFYSTV